jgi:hypothetical protein
MPCDLLKNRKMTDFVQRPTARTWRFASPDGGPQPASVKLADNQRWWLPGAYPKPLRAPQLEFFGGRV